MRSRINKFVILAVISFSAAATAAAEEAVFRDVQLPAEKGKLINATLTFSDQTKAVVIHPSNGEPISIPYEAIDKFSYEYTKKHRI